MVTIGGQVTGPTIILGSTKYFNGIDPDSTPILTIGDIAWSLGHEGRFAHQLRDPLSRRRLTYMVGQHVVIDAEQVPIHLSYYALMHETGEVIWGDLCGPLKKEVPRFKELEKRTEISVNTLYHAVPELESDIVILKEYDTRMLATERRDLTAWRDVEWEWVKDSQPFNFKIRPWTGDYSTKRFLETFKATAPWDDINPYLLSDWDETYEQVKYATESDYR